MNIQFNYLYRDAANYKNYHSVTFSNDTSIVLEKIEQRIQETLIDGAFFYVDKWRLRDLHLHPWDNRLDHTWHEFESIEETNDETDCGDIADFLEIIGL